MPVVTARATFASTPAGSIAKPPSKSALTGTSTAAAIARRCASASSSVTVVSDLPRLQAKPELVVASAGKPSISRYRALPTSHGFGMTKQPDSWSSRKRATRSVEGSMRATIPGNGDASQRFGKGFASLSRLSQNSQKPGRRSVPQRPSTRRSHMNDAVPAEGNRCTNRSPRSRLPAPRRSPRRRPWRSTPRPRLRHRRRRAAPVTSPRRPSSTARRAVGPGFVFGAVLASALLASGGTYVGDQRHEPHARRPRRSSRPAPSRAPATPPAGPRSSTSSRPSARRSSRSSPTASPPPTRRPARPGRAPPPAPASSSTPTGSSSPTTTSSRATRSR